VWPPGLQRCELCSRHSLMGSEPHMTVSELTEPRHQPSYCCRSHPGKGSSSQDVLAWLWNGPRGHPGHCGPESLLLHLCS
jgi:hypothetical protein